MDKLGWHLPGNGLGDSAVIVTRGASNGKLVAGLCSGESIVCAFRQNDKPAANGKVPADEWLMAVAECAGCKVLHVVTPEPHKDPNDWTLAGATAEQLWRAVREAKLVSPLTPEASLNDPRPKIQLPGNDR